jgi:Family of unknown function (DUF5372)
VTHPFHQRHRHKFLPLGVRQSWSEDRVFFLNGQGGQHSLPVGWTDMLEADAFFVASAGSVSVSTRGSQRSQV